MLDGRLRRQCREGPPARRRQPPARRRHAPTTSPSSGSLMAVAAAVAIGAGRAPSSGCVLLVLTAVPDLLDGAVAKASGTASPRGAFFDSVADRVSDALLLGGVAWYLATATAARRRAGAGGAGVSMLISYERAKAESLGFDAKRRAHGAGRADRRCSASGCCSTLLVAVLWVMLVLTPFTAVQRFVKVWRQASRRPSRCPTAAPPLARSPHRRAPPSAAWRRWAAEHPPLAPRPPARPRWPPHPPYLTYRVPPRLARALPPSLAPVEQAATGSRVSAMSGDAARPGRAQPPPGPRRRRRERRAARGPSDETFGSYGRYWSSRSACRAPRPSVARRGHAAGRLRAGRRRRRGRHGRDPGPAPPRRLGVGRLLGGRSGNYPVSVVVEAVEPPELVDWFGELRRSFGMEMIPLGPGAGSASAQGAAGEPGGVPAVRPRHQRGRHRRRVLRRDHHAARRSGHARAAQRRAAAPGGRLLPGGGQHEAPGAARPRHGPAGLLPCRRRPRHPGPRPRASRRSSGAAPEQWHLLQPNWPSDLVD